MFNKFTNLFLKFADKKIVIALAIISFIFTLIFQFLAKFFAVESSDIIKLELSFTKQTVVKLFAKWGSSGINYFKLTVWIDFLYIISYVIFLSSFIAVLTNKKEQQLKNIYLVFFSLPFLAGTLDYVENFFLLFILTNTNKVSAVMVLTESLISSAKWFAVLISVLVILYFLFFKLITQMEIYFHRR